MVRQDGFLDVLARAAEVLDRRQSDADRKNLAAWDASDAVHRDASADGYLALQLLGADAEKLAGRELACLAPDGSTSAVLADLAAVPLLLAALQLVLEELDKPDVGRFAAQSCAVQAAADERAVSARQHVELGQ
jgi:ferric-dicitrate binding protein FerR (iron transport regulator)